MLRARTLAAAAALAVVATLAPARAVADDASNKAAAEALFDDGKRLLQEGHFAEAAQKLEASQRLDAGIGTLLYLADAYEKGGRTASAWATFREAASTARSAGQAEREEIARSRAALLEPKLSKLALVVSEEAPGTEIRRGGALVPKELWGVDVPLDPGRYEIRVTAPGRAAYATTVELAATPGVKKVELPKLAVEAPAGTSAPVPARAEPGPVPVGTQRVIGATLGGIGVIGLVVAAVFAGEAKTKDGQAADHCDGTRCRDPLGASLSTDARTAGDVATVAFVAGAGALAAGAIVFFTAPSRPSGASPVKTGALRSLRLAPRIGLASGGLDLGGAW